MLKINDIFYSIQGEGANTGMPAIFIRFAGCNRECPYCDTRHESYTEMTAMDVIRKLNFDGLSCRNIIFTGGEPTLQMGQEFWHLFKNLKNYHNNYVCIETNGDRVKHLRMFDWVTFSPKTMDANMQECDEIKFIYDSHDITPQDLATYQMIKHKYFYLQPSKKKYMKNVIEIAKQRPFVFRVSFQAQKVFKFK